MIKEEAAIIWHETLICYCVAEKRIIQVQIYQKESILHLVLTEKLLQSPPLPSDERAKKLGFSTCDCRVAMAFRFLDSKYRELKI